jgi:Tfp pilus assembly protein PilN
MRPLNLATRPFRNEGLPQVALSLATVILLAVSVLHGRAIYRLLPGQTSGLAKEVNVLEDEGRGLRQDASRLRNVKPSAADSARWSAIKELVDRRVFPWTRLFAALEEVLPKNVRLVNIAPSAHKTGFEVQLQAVARSSEDGYQMMEALENRPEFDNVRPESRGAQSEAGLPIEYTMKYNPAAAPPAPPSPSPAAEPTPGPATPGEQP